MKTEYSRLISSLKDRSKEGRIAWGPSSYADTYEAPLGKGAVMIMLKKEPVLLQGLTPIPIAKLTLLNERGGAFGDVTCFYEHDEGYEDLKAIYEAAHNNYMQIDETFKSMFDDLNNRL